MPDIVFPDLMVVKQYFILALTFIFLISTLLYWQVKFFLLISYSCLLMNFQSYRHRIFALFSAWESIPYRSDVLLICSKVTPLRFPMMPRDLPI